MPNNATEDLFVGVDVGTSGCRAVAIDTQGQVHAESRFPWPNLSRENSRSEQNAELWWQGVVDVLHQLASQCQTNQVRAMALDATSATVLLADAQGKPIGPALMYNDQRAAVEAEKLRQQIPSGVAAHGASSGLAKLLWLASRYGKADQVHYFLHQTDWLLGRLCGRFGISDYNNALKTGFDAQTKCWPAWIESLPFPHHWLPQVYAPGTPIGHLQANVANAVGLSTDVQIVTGTTDSTAAFLATGAGDVGDAVTSLGSTLVIKVMSATPVQSTEYGVYSQPLHDHWLVGGASNSGGNVLRAFFSDDELRKLTPELNPDVATDLDYYPLLKPGERFPYHDPSLPPRLSPRPDADSRFLQGLLEGMARIEYTGYQRLAELGAPRPISIRTVGGGSQNTAWTRLRQRLLDVPLIAPVSDQAAYGAALLARRGGLQKQLEKE